MDTGFHLQRSMTMELFLCLVRRMRIGVTLALPGLWCVAASAQDALVSISAEPKGVEYRVDTARYFAPTTFTWPKGSKHIIEFAVQDCTGQAGSSSQYQYQNDCRIRFTGVSWETNKGPIIGVGVMLPFTADPEINKVTLRATVQYRVDLGLPTGPQEPALPVPVVQPGPRLPGGPIGLACVGSSCYHYAVQLWLSPGEYILQAFPYEGFAFVGWGLDGGQLQPFQGKFRVPGPYAVMPYFTHGKRVQIYTDPLEMNVLIDRTEVPTIDPRYYREGSKYPVPGYFDWADSSVHLLAAPSPQFDPAGNLMAFDSWVNSAGDIIGGQNTDYKVNSVNIRETLIAKFVPGARVFVATPAGLKVSVDGRDNWPSYNFVWGVGTKHTISAPLEQYDKNGRKHLFKRWSTGGSATQEIAVNAELAATGIRLTAEYEMLGMLVVQSSVAGVTVKVDSEDCETPCTLHRPAGSDIRMGAPTNVSTAPGIRLEFVSWNSGQEMQHTLTLTGEPVVRSATYRHAFLVTAISEPSGSSDLRIEPPSVDGYYPANSNITAYASSRAGFKFRRWEGDVSGVFSPVSISVGGPRTIKAVYDKVPAIAPAGIRNAAGESSVSGVAPGSIISIYGASLAAEFVSGPANPLVQTLAGTSVYAGNRLLPLFFVSPEQINAQLPFDLPVGTYTLTVKNRNLPDASTIFEAIRNAPGLFTSLQAGQMIVAVARVAGPAVTAENPVKPGELLNVFGTGFGPHWIAPPEGFAVEEADEFRLVDPIQIVLADKVIVPEYAGSAAGLPGVVVLRFRMPADFLDASMMNLAARVNGITTNSATLLGAQTSADKAAEEAAP